MAKKDLKDEKSRKHSSKIRKPEPAKKPAPDFDDEEDEAPPADDAAAELLDEAVKSTPWWAMSLAFHGLLLSALPLIVFAKGFIAKDAFAMQTIIVRKPQSLRISDPDPSNVRSLRATPGELSSEKPDDTPQIKFFEAVEGDHFESADGDDHHGIKGDSMEALSRDLASGDSSFAGRIPGAGPGNNIAMGVGGGSGSPGRRFGGAFGGRINMYKKAHGTSVGDAVECALMWLARHQSPDGHWSSEGYHSQCANGRCTGDGLNDFDVGNTGLALLGFLGAGYTPAARKMYRDPVTKQVLCFGETIRKGLKWLVEHQNSDGAIGPQVGEMMYNHAIAALALSEGYGLTNAPSYRIPAQKAINFIVMAQNYGLGWRYTPKCNNNDTSVTGWCVMALKSAQISGLEVPQTSFIGAKAWLDRVTDSNGQHGYDRLGSGEIYVPGKNEKWMHHPSMTAVGLLCRIFIDKKKGDKVLGDAAKIVGQDVPRWDPQAPRPTVDFYYWYYATLAMFQFHGPEAPAWKTWNAAIMGALCGHQRTSKDGCLDGSWDTENVDRWAYAGGRVYGTAINVLTLETSFRYEHVFGAK